MVKNQWRPDTCGCVLEYEFDADAPEDTRVHTPTACLNACAAHPDASDIAAHHASVLAENVKKNTAINEVKSQLSEADAKAVAWSFDEARNLTITVPQGTDATKLTVSDGTVKVA